MADAVRKDRDPDPHMASNFFEHMWNGFILPTLRNELRREPIPAELPDRWQVVFVHDSDLVEVRLNDGVLGHGVATVRATQDIEAGEQVEFDSIESLDRWVMPEDGREITHVTGYWAGDKWWLAFDLNRPHADRLTTFQRGQEFCAAAIEQVAAGRLVPGIEMAFAAAELFATAELLSYGPTVERIIGISKHSGRIATYKQWANLGNTDKRFADLLVQLHQERAPARYDDRGKQSRMDLDLAEAVRTLAAMEQHVEKVVGGETPGRFTMFASRETKAGQMVTESDYSLIPLKRPRTA